MFFRHLKEYCKDQIKNVEKWGGDPQLALTRCYGAMMFVDYYLTKEGFNTDSLGIGKWWENEMLPQFHDLINRKRIRK